MGRRLIAPPVAILAGAALLAWPIALNGYPIVFSDTGALLDMGLLFHRIGWDKPFVYGPLAAAISLHRSLVVVAAAQTGAPLLYTLGGTVGLRPSLPLASHYALPRPCRRHVRTMVCLDPPPRRLHRHRDPRSPHQSRPPSATAHSAITIITAIAIASSPFPPCSRHCDHCRPRIAPF